MSQPLKLFVNYRRADNPHFVELIRTWLFIRYGRDNVFMDFDSLPNFTEFEDFIRHKIRESDAVICIIGPRWEETLSQRDRDGAKDYVRIELEEALHSQKLVAPICILGADPPPQGSIPASLRPIFDTWNVARLRDGKEVIEKIHRIMDDLEALLARRGVYGKPQSLDSELAQERGTKQGEPLDLYGAYGRLLTAYKRNEWDVVLGWIAELRESGLRLPGRIQDELLAIEQESQQAIASRGERDRAHQVAAFLYGFAQARWRAGYSDDVLRDLLQDVWTVLPGYDPDDIGDHLPPATSPSDAPANDVVSNPAALLRPSATLLPPPFEWCEVAGGYTFVEGGGYIDLARQSFIVEPFMLAMYPLTNAQYDVFVHAFDGYRDMDWWDFSDEAWRWRRKNPESKPSRFLGDDLPRTNVSWYDAVAYCRWLTAQTSLAIQLPTEQQWQLAAQGQTERRYPWGNDAPTPERANYGSLVGAPTPVGSYPAGVAVSGAHDMIGNVWEWCLTGFASGTTDIERDEPRVLRGGGWLYNTDTDLRIQFRSHLIPTSTSGSRGFRLAMLP